MVETCRFAHQVPLADESCLVARCLKEFGHCLLGTVEDTVFVVGKAIDVAMLACEHTCTAGTRKAVGHETVAEQDTFLGNLIKVGSLNVTVAIGTECLRRVVVRHDIDDIWALALCLSRKGRHSSHGKN